MRSGARGARQHPVGCRSSTGSPPPGRGVGRQLAGAVLRDDLHAGHAVRRDTSVLPAGNPLDFRISATRSLYVDAGSEPALTPFGMLVFTNVSRSPTVFCVKPFQNVSPRQRPVASVLRQRVAVGARLAERRRRARGLRVRVDAVPHRARLRICGLRVQQAPGRGHHQHRRQGFQHHGRFTGPPRQPTARASAPSSRAPAFLSPSRS